MFSSQDLRNSPWPPERWLKAAREDVPPRANENVAVDLFTIIGADILGTVFIPWLTIVERIGARARSCSGLWAQKKITGRTHEHISAESDLCRHCLESQILTSKTGSIINLVSAILLSG
jgi:hypothetical protein